MAERPPVELPFEREEYVVVEIVDGRIRAGFVHLPARRAVAAGRGGPLFSRYDFPPSTWPSACRQVESGAVYVRAGVLENAPICPDCEAAA